MKPILALLALAALAVTAQPSLQADAQTRIRDVVDVEGVRQNDLIGYGIVVGLNGTGDSVRNSPFTEDSLTYMLERLGVNVQGEDIKPDNVAAVLVTATLPSFARNGSTLDISVASIGDAESLAKSGAPSGRAPGRSCRCISPACRWISTRSTRWRCPAASG